MAHCYLGCGAGVSFGATVKDALYSKPLHHDTSHSRHRHRHVAGGVGPLTDVLFRSSLVFPLTMGLIAAYPVGLDLIYFGVKEGMMNPGKTVSDRGT